MKSLPVAFLVGLLSQHASALPTNFLITFVPYDKSKPFTLCVAEQDEGSFPPCQDGGRIVALLTGPYAAAQGTYDICNNRLSIGMGFEGANNTTTALDLTAETKNQQFKKVYNPRFIIYTFPNAQRPVTDVTGPPAAASIVTTGSFTIASSCKKS